MKEMLCCDVMSARPIHEKINKIKPVAPRINVTVTSSKTQLKVIQDNKDIIKGSGIAR